MKSVNGDPICYRSALIQQDHTMARVICRTCHVQYNAALQVCPSCGEQPLRSWQRLLNWHWPVPLAIGLALQILSQHAGLQQSRLTLQRLPQAQSISQFITGVVIFSVLAALLLFVLRWMEAARRRMIRRRRQRRVGMNRSR